MKKESINQIVDELNHDGQIYLDDYDSSLFPEDVYKDLLQKFKNPINVTYDDIKRTLQWKYGRIRQPGFPSAKNHKNMVDRIWDNWPNFIDFLNSKKQTLKDIYNFLDTNKVSHVTNVFICHLILYDNENIIPIIDQHNFRCMNYLIQKYDGQKKMVQRQPKYWGDLEKLRFFIIDLINNDIKYKYRELDKILMVMGKKIQKDLPK